MGPLQKITIKGVVLKSFEIHSINITHPDNCISLLLSLENRPNISNFAKIPQIWARFLPSVRFSPQRGHPMQVSRWCDAHTICSPHARYRHRHGIACRGSISGFPELGGSRWESQGPTHLRIFSRSLGVWGGVVGVRVVGDGCLNTL